VLEFALKMKKLEHVFKYF